MRNFVAVKKIDSFLKWFGLSSTAIGLVYTLFYFSTKGRSSSGVLNEAVAILFVIGFPCAVCGLLRYDPMRPYYKVFCISKYVGLFCLIFALSFLLFQTNAVAQTYAGSMFAIIGFGALVLCIICAVLGIGIKARR